MKFKWAPKNKSCPNELKFCTDSRNPFSMISSFYLKEQKKVLFPKKVYVMLVIQTLKCRISYFLNSNTCFCLRLYGKPDNVFRTCDVTLVFIDTIHWKEKRAKKKCLDRKKKYMHWSYFLYMSTINFWVVAQIFCWILDSTLKVSFDRYLSTPRCYILSSTNLFNIYYLARRIS